MIERERDIFVFGEKKKERKKERDAFSSVDRRDPPLSFLSFPSSQTTTINSVIIKLYIILC